MIQKHGWQLLFKGVVVDSGEPIDDKPAYPTFMKLVDAYDSVSVAQVKALIVKSGVKSLWVESILKNS